MTLDEFAQLLENSIASLPLRLEEVVQETVRLGAIDARASIGHLQPGWPPLAASTKHAKAKLGFAPPDYAPLERTGEMRDSIFAGGEGLTGTIESDSPIIGYHEYGTAKMPARPVIGPSLLEAVLQHGMPGLRGIAETLLEE